MLHLVFKSPIDVVLFERIASDDAIVFLENAALDLLAAGKLASAIKKYLPTHSMYVISEDMVARGIQPEELVSGLQVIDYPGLVELTVKHNPIQSWS